jgi:hypothetical protein
MLLLGGAAGLLEIIGRLSIGACDGSSSFDGIAIGLRIQGGCHLKLSRDDIGGAQCPQNSVRNSADLHDQQNNA